MSTRRAITKSLLATVAAMLMFANASPAVAAPFAYISNRGASGDVSVIDVATSTVVATISTPGSPQGVAVHPDGTRVYVTNNPGTNIFVIDTATNTVSGSIAVAASPIGIAVNSAGTRAYVAHAGDTTVSVIDITINSVIASVPVAADPAGVAVTPSGAFVYVAHFGGNTVTVINASNNTVFTTIPVGASPQGVTVNPAGTLVYVTNTTPDSVSVISTATNTVVATVPGISTPYAVVVTPDGSRAYVSASGGNSVAVINTASNLVTASVPVGSAPRGISVSPDGSRVYVANTNSNTVTVISTSSNTVAATVPVGSSPYAFGSFIGGPIPTFPGAPTIGAATAGDGQATVTYTPPGSNGGSPILSYTATSTPGGLTGNATSGPIVVMGLSNGTPYTFTVTATNAIGTGPSSAPSNSVTPTGPAPFITTVTTSADAGAGSLRQALLDVQSNCSAPTKTVNFNIPGGGPHIILLASPLPTITCGNTTIDGYSQPGATPNTLPNAASGSNAVIKIVIDGALGTTMSSGIHAAAPATSIRGLSLVAFYFEGIFFSSGATGSSAEGNFIGVLPDGTPSPNLNGVGVAGNTVTVGGAPPAARNVVACNTGPGIAIYNSANAVIYNNDIGGKPDGATPCGNGKGISFDVNSGGEVGAMGGGNFIRNNLGHGVYVNSANNVPVVENVIVNNSGSGIYLDNGSDCASTGVRISGNSIGIQGGQGIDLALPGRDVNDPLDADGGGGCPTEGNRGQNYPTIDLVTYRPDKTLLNFTLASEPSKSYEIEVFSNAIPDVTDAGRGETSLGVEAFSSDTGGIVSAAGVQVSSAPDALNLSMLATDQVSGDTSEFSRTYITPFAFAPLAGPVAYNITVGSPATQTVNFTNITAQSIGNIAVAISPPGNFTVSVDNCTGSPVVSTNTCNVFVQYNRATAGSDSAVLTVTVPVASNSFLGADTAYEFALTGNATAGSPPSIAPTSHAFGAVTVGGFADFQITLSGGSGATALTFNSNNAQYTIVNNTCGTTIAAAMTCTFDIRYAPSAVSGTSAVITVGSLAGNIGTVSVSGNGTQPVTAFVPASHPHGASTVSQPNVLAGTFNNNSPVPITISGAITSNSSLFVVAPAGANPCNPGTVLPPTGSCTYTSTFTPVAVAGNSAVYTFSFTAGALVTPVFSDTVSVSGNGTQPVTAFVPASHPHGASTVSQPNVLAGTFNNNSPVPITISGAITSNSSLFVVAPAGANPCNPGTVLPPTGSCTYTSTFTPVAVAGNSAVYTFSFTAGALVTPVFTDTVSVSGNGTQPVTAFVPASHPHGATTVAQANVLPGTFNNNSPVSITISGAITSNSSLFVVAPAGANPCNPGTVLPPTGSCTYTSTFTPVAVAGNSAVYTFSFTAGALVTPVFSATVSVNGNGTQPVTAFVPASHPHGATTVAQANVLPGTFNNNSPVPITISGAITSNSSLFVPVPAGASPCNPGTVLPPTGSCTYTSTFTPVAVAGNSAVYTFSFTAGALVTPVFSVTVSVNGNGVAAANPTMSVSFAPTSVTPGVNATMTLTLTNPAASSAFISAGSITIPVGLTATPPGSNSCGTFGSVSAGAYSFGMGNIPAMGSCTIDLTVQSPTPGTYTATIMPGALSAGAGMNTNTSSAALTVTALAPPTISFAVTPTSIVVGGTSVGTLTINNPNAVPLTANPVVFNYLPGLVNAPVPNASSTCAGASIAPIPGAGSYTQATPFTLPASGSCTFSVTITSNTPGVYSGTIMAGLIVTPAGSSNATPFSITVTAAPTPAVSLAPPTVNFGARTVNTTSPPSIVTLTNSGTANLIISNIAGSGDFGFTTTCPLLTPPVIALGTCTISITFTPLTVAALTGSITITSNAPGSPHTIALTGTGSAVPVPAVNLSTLALNLGNQVVNTSSAIQSIAVTNGGFATLVISGITVTGSGSFTRVSPASPSPDCATSLAPSGTCYISVIFTPTATGAVTAQINIASNALGSPHAVALSGTGISAAIPAISVPGSVAFGDQVITTSGTQTLTIGSIGSAALDISAIALGGIDAASFVTSGSCITITIGANCVITITFTPTSVGAKSAQLTITSNAAGQPATTITLIGNAILAPRPIVELSVTAIGYGNAIFGGATAGQVVTLRNTGGVALNIQNLFTSGEFVVMSSCPASLASGAACVINILFSPLGIGFRAGELVLVTNALGSPHHIPLSGTGCRWFSQAQSRFFLTLCG